MAAGRAGTLLEDKPSDGETPRPTCSQSCLRMFGLASGAPSEHKEQGIGDFVIQKVLGRGTYGVVVLVHDRSESVGGTASPVLYAMKMQNTEVRHTRGMATDVGPSRDMAAIREQEILRNLHHPFIVRLKLFFEVPDREFKTSNGEVVKDSSNNTRFHRVIVMEYAAAGDLDGYVCQRASMGQYAVSYAEPQGSRGGSLNAMLDDDGVDWLCTARRFGAEMCVALSFLHSQNIIYRDLKPQNVLLKVGRDKELHTVFTDFGSSKQLSEDSVRADSLAGTALYAAPEVLKIMEQRHRSKYTPAVDLYSLGKTVLVCLWRTRLPIERPELQMPWPETYAGDPRVPEAARKFIEQITAQRPLTRGTSDKLHTAQFFADLQPMSESQRILPAISWDTLTSVV